jgi:hypothetical protein
LDWRNKSLSGEGLGSVLHRAQALELCGDTFVVVPVDVLVQRRSQRIKIEISNVVKDLPPEPYRPGELCRGQDPASECLLRTRNRELTEQIALASSQIQQLSFEAHQLRSGLHQRAAFTNIFTYLHAR